MWKTLAPVLAGIWMLLATVALAADRPEAESFVIAIERFAGGDGADLDRFTVAADGSWEFKPQGGEPTKGKLSADAVSRWVKEIEDGGLYTVKSDPDRGGTDESFMDITVRVKDRKTRVRIALEEKLSRAIDRKIAEVLKPGK
jgi:hypothetical protein